MLRKLRTWLAGRFLARLQTPRDVVRFAVRRYAERIALIDGRRRLTYAELGARMYAIATAWRELGLRPGDVVAVRLPDGEAQILARLAAAECGAALLMLAPWMEAERVREALRATEAALYIHDPAETELAADIAQPMPGFRALALARGDEQWLRGVVGAPNPEALDPDGVALIGFTSGTTGAPKLMTSTHRAYLTGLRLMVANVGAGANSDPYAAVVGIPMTGAGSGLLLPTLITGGSLVAPAAYEAGALIAAVERHGAVRLFTTPSLLIDMLDHDDLAHNKMRSLRNIIYGTEMMPVEKLIEALHRFGPVLQQGYGSAEVLPPVALLQPHEHMFGPQPARREVLMSCGRVIPQARVRILDEAGTEMPPGETGDVWVKSPTVFGGYWRRPDLSRDSLRDGWLRIGDIGRLDRQGRLTVLGRRADLLHGADGPIYPRLVEEAMHTHPAIKEAVYVQGPEGRVMAYSLRRAFRQPREEADWQAELSRELAAKVPASQMPDAWRQFEELPRSRLGKVLRREVRAQLEARSSA